MTQVADNEEGGEGSKGGEGSASPSPAERVAEKGGRADGGEGVENRRVEKGVENRHCYTSFCSLSAFCSFTVYHVFLLVDHLGGILIAGHRPPRQL